MSLLPPLDTRHEGNEPVHHEVRKALALEAGRRRPHDPFPSERTVAREYHINRLTVRKAIDALVQDGTLYRVVRRGTFVSPQKRPTKRLVLICSHLCLDGASPCPHDAICTSFREEATSLRHEVTSLGLAHSSPEDLRDRLIKLRPDAAILCHPDPGCDLGLLRQAGCPIVRVGLWLPSGDMDTVAADGFAAASLACRHLSRLGHRRIGIVGHSASTARDALNPLMPVLCAGCEAASIEYHFALPCEARVLSDDRAERRRALTDLLRGPHPPSAFVAADRDLAQDVLACAHGPRRADGSKVDVIALEASPSERPPAPFPSVVVDLREIGRLALRTALMNGVDERRPPCTVLANPTLRTGPGDAASTT
ncbi:MAG: GntR family transcriptional regulator [Planctomycetes bacterium]|nr:GntR family transcriptional regulator [Planctomycetota bacterium]